MDEINDIIDRHYKDFYYENTNRRLECEQYTPPSTPSLPSNVSTTTEPGLGQDDENDEGGDDRAIIRGKTDVIIGRVKYTIDFNIAIGHVLLNRTGSA